MRSLRIVTTAKISAADKAALFRWGEDLWDNDKYGLTWRRTDVNFVGYEADNAVTVSGAVLHTIAAQGSDLRLGGLNSVLTLPAARGRGYGGLIVDAAETYMRDTMQADFGMLFCHTELIPFYGPRGWHAIGGPITIDQPSGPIESPHTVMVLPFTDRTWQDGPLTLNSLPW